MNGMLRNPVVYDALDEYFLDHRDEAISLWLEHGTDDPIFDSDGFDDLLDTMDGSKAFQLGVRAEIDPYDEWFMFDVYGNVRSLSYGHVETEALDFVMSTDFKDEIVSGKADVPFDLETVIRLWGPGGTERRKAYPYEEPSGNRDAKGRRSRR